MPIIDPGKSAEYLFASKCLKHQFNTVWPSSQMDTYDLVVDNGVSMIKIQVKSTRSLNKGAYYKINVSKHGGKDKVQPYEKDDFDLLACYVEDLHVWYIIPSRLVEGKVTIGLYPHRSDEKIGQYENFKEAWHLLKEGK